MSFSKKERHVPHSLSVVKLLRDLARNSGQRSNSLGEEHDVTASNRIFTAATAAV